MFSRIYYDSSFAYEAVLEALSEPCILSNARAFEAVIGAATGRRADKPDLIRELESADLSVMGIPRILQSADAVTIDILLADFRHICRELARNSVQLVSLVGKACGTS